jgi:hypothetical protein
MDNSAIKRINNYLRGLVTPTRVVTPPSGRRGSKREGSPPNPTMTTPRDTKKNKPTMAMIPYVTPSPSRGMDISPQRASKRKASPKTSSLQQALINWSGPDSTPTSHPVFNYSPPKKRVAHPIPDNTVQWTRIPDVTSPTMPKRSTRKSSLRSGKYTRKVVGGPTISRRRPHRVNRPNTSPQLRENVAGFLNPLHPGAPRIMDGKAPESQTFNHREVFDLSLDNGSINNIICLAPNISTPFQGIYTQSAGAGDNNFYIHPPTFDFSYTLNGTAPGVNFTINTFLTLEGAIDRWRMVSSGMRITLLNTSEQNDGWYEAWRVTDIPTAQEFELMEKAGAATSLAAIIAPSFLTSQASYSNRIQFESYHVGSLKDIHNGIFSLRPITMNHPWKNLEDRIDSNAGLVNVPDTRHNQNYYKCNDNQNEDRQRLRNTLWDETFDTVLIVIHPGNNDCQLLVECATNLEVVYEATSQFARFMIPTQTDYTLNKHLHSAHKSSPLAIR